MFDDSKRLDALEAGAKSLSEAHNATVKMMDSNTKAVNDRFEKLDKRISDAITEINKHIEIFKKADSAHDKADGTHDTAIAKLQQRCANLEAAVKKLQK